MSTFSVSVEERDRARYVVTVVGELDLARAEGLGEQLDALLAPGALVALDAAGLTFMDSTGLRILLRATARAADRGAGFRLVAPQAAVLRVLELSGTVGAIETRDDLAAAFDD